MRPVSFSLRPPAPFRLDLTVWALRRRPHNRIDVWDGRTYRRTFRWRDQPVEVAVVQTGPPETPELQVSVHGSTSGFEAETAFARILSRMLGWELDLAQFYRFAARRPFLGSLASRWRGFRPPRFPTLFETVVNSIACLQVSPEAGISLINRLAETYGWTRFSPAGRTSQIPLSFPEAHDLVGLDLADLRRLGFSRTKARAVIDLARLASLGAIRLEALEYLDEDEARRFLARLLGAGRGIIDYMLLRGLGRWQFFPLHDAGVRPILARWFHLSEPLDYQGVRRLLQPWQPYLGLVYFLGLLESLAAEGLVTPSL